MSLLLVGLGTKVQTFLSMKLSISTFMAVSYDSLSDWFLAILYVGKWSTVADWAWKLPYIIGVDIIFVVNVW